jgi:hypothetical protein
MVMPPLAGAKPGPPRRAGKNVSQFFGIFYLTFKQTASKITGKVRVSELVNSAKFIRRFGDEKAALHFVFGFHAVYFN